MNNQEFKSSPKCDFCDKPMTSYGSQMCYVACDDHVKEGEVIEKGMWEEIEKNQNET